MDYPHPQDYLKKIDQTRRTVFERFPLVFTLLATFGLVATLYGFEGIINRIDLLANNPFILLVTGILTLGITGTLYRNLSR